MILFTGYFGDAQNAEILIPRNPVKKTGVKKSALKKMDKANLGFDEELQNLIKFLSKSFTVTIFDTSDKSIKLVLSPKGEE